MLIGDGLEKIGCAEWLSGLILDGIVAGVGAVLGFVPQMLVLFLLLAFLEACGYMARIAFVLDRVFRKFGLSGKSFIPILVGMGCGVPGIMASRTIENQRDRRMTIMTTTFIPCGAKTALHRHDRRRYLRRLSLGRHLGLLPGHRRHHRFRYHPEEDQAVRRRSRSLRYGAARLPLAHRRQCAAQSMWERGWSFIKKAGTIILLSTIFVWFTTYFGWADGKFQMLGEEQIDSSILAYIGNAIAWIFKPLGWGNWQAAVASITGLVAKENIVGTLGILYGASGHVYTALANAFTPIAGYSFLAFNLLCAPCFAAMGAIKREMNNAKWTWFAIGYQCGFAYLIALMINQLGLLFTGNGFGVGTVFAILVAVGMIYMLVRKNRYED